MSQLSRNPSKAPTGRPHTSAPGIVLFLHAAKPKAHKGKVLLVNASQIFEKGNPKNFIPPAGIAA